MNCQSGDLLAQEQSTAAAKEKVLDALGEAASKVRGDAVAFKSRDLDLVALDDALIDLAKLTPRQSQIVIRRRYLRGAHNPW